MFALTDTDLTLKILGCADGPANFNAQMHQKGHHVISCDPLYQLTAEQIQQRIEATYQDVITQTHRNQEKFLWDTIASPEELGRLRLAAMSNFLEDYAQGKSEGRYFLAELPYLPFPTLSFDIALCSHFLFLYSANFTLEFHQQAIEAMCRVAHEVRIFPLLTYNAEPSPYVAPVVEHFQSSGFEVSLETVVYEFQRGGNQMLRISRLS